MPKIKRAGNIAKSTKKALKSKDFKAFGGDKGSRTPDLLNAIRIARPNRVGCFAASAEIF